MRSSSEDEPQGESQGESMTSLNFAVRTLFRTPFVTAIAVLSLALGIGANTAIFSLFNQMLLRPLPVQSPQTLVNLSNPGPKPGSQSCGQAGGCDVVFSYPMFRDLEGETKDRKSTRLNSSHSQISYAVFCLKKKK